MSQQSVTCDVCGADSEYCWRCTECGKPFETSEKSGRDQEVRR